MKRNYDVIRIRKNFLTDHQLKLIADTLVGIGLNISEDDQLVIGWKEREENGKEENGKKSAEAEKDKSQNERGAKSGTAEGKGKGKG